MIQFVGVGIKCRFVLAYSLVSRYSYILLLMDGGRFLFPSLTGRFNQYLVVGVVLRPDCCFSVTILLSVLESVFGEGCLMAFFIYSLFPHA
jgi:hypothetical protein